MAVRSNDEAHGTTAFLVSLGLVIALGALIGTVCGYAMHVASFTFGGQPLPIVLWLQLPFGGPVAWWPWPAFGAIIACLVFLLRKLSAQ